VEAKSAAYKKPIAKIVVKAERAKDKSVRWIVPVVVKREAVLALRNATSTRPVGKLAEAQVVKSEPHPKNAEVEAKRQDGLFVNKSVMCVEQIEKHAAEARSVRAKNKPCLCQKRRPARMFLPNQAQRHLENLSPLVRKIVRVVLHQIVLEKSGALYSIFAEETELAHLRPMLSLIPDKEEEEQRR
jgi:hypothetical protein